MSLVFEILSTKPPTYPLRPIMMNNARTVCLTAAAGTDLASTSYQVVVQSLSSHPKALYNFRLHHAQILAGSGFRPLPKIPHCCPPQKIEPYSSSDVAVRSPKPATNHQLGKLLPHQLLNSTSAHLTTTSLLKNIFFSFSTKKRCFFIRYFTNFNKYIPNYQVGSNALRTRSPLYFIYVK